MIVVDTHVLVWWFSDPRRLSPRAARALAGASIDDPAVVSTVSILEIVAAVRRGRLELTRSPELWIDDLRTIPELRFEPVSVEIAAIAGSFGEGMHGDPADRLIAATAIALDGAVVTADRRLRSWRGLKTIW